MMDASIGWIQPEQKGPALELWWKFWRDFNQSPAKQTNDCAAAKSEDNDDSNQKESDTKRGVLSFLPAKVENPSLTIDLDNNPQLIREFKGTPWRTDEDIFEGIDGLHREIDMFFNYMKPRPEESKYRGHAIEHMTKVIRTLWNDAVVSVFGSTSTRTYLPTSDIDLVVNIKASFPITLRLIQLEQHLLNLNQCKPNEMIRLDRAAVPVLKLRHIDSNFQINIIFNSPQVFDAAELIKDYKRQYPCLVKLLYVIKYFVLERDMNMVYRGGLSSYALVLMIVHFFKNHPELVVGKDKPNLGELLLRFLELYGRLLNYEKVGLRVSNGTYIDKQLILEKSNGKPSRYPPSLLCIEDPLDVSNNVTRGSYNIVKIRDAFDYAFDMLNRAVGPQRAVIDSKESILGRIIRVTDEVVHVRENMIKKFHELPPHRNFYRGCPYRTYNNGQKTWIDRHNGRQNNTAFFANGGQQRPQQQRKNYPNRHQPNVFGASNQRDGRYLSYYSFDNNQNYQRKKAQQIYNNPSISCKPRDQGYERPANGEKALNGSNTSVRAEGRGRANTME